eukprot:364051-Chlamydomonas_euryale.AAC.18
MALALSDFEALCGFCPAAELRDVLVHVPELARAVGEAESAAFVRAKDGDAEVTFLAHQGMRRGAGGGFGEMREKKLIARPEASASVGSAEADLCVCQQTSRVAGARRGAEWYTLVWERTAAG